jgi:glutamate N-acetyltransferase/amino-acid N-acetyltransferase
MMSSSSPISPLAPTCYPILSPLNGVALYKAHTGIRYQGRPDLLTMHFAPETQVAGVFTKNLLPAAPVLWDQKLMRLTQQARALVVNAGNANAYTGEEGIKAVRVIVNQLTELHGYKETEIFMASTGVIGQALQTERLTQALNREMQPASWEDAARAIMTTDTFPKYATRSVAIGEHTVTIHGIAKGSGMIAPDMATMLCFIATDATIPMPALQAMLNRANEQSFNSITVDGDTSTNDTVLFFATGSVAHTPINSHRVHAIAPFVEALESLMKELAQLVVRDGEGAQKFITIRVIGANSTIAARHIAKTIGESPLVKTALAASDANWGRIMMAIGRAGERIDVRFMKLWFGDVLVAANGTVHPDYNEEQVIPMLQSQNIAITVDVGMKGSGEATIWTCDLTHGYIDINGSYRS